MVLTIKLLGNFLQLVEGRVIRSHVADGHGSLLCVEETACESSLATSTGDSREGRGGCLEEHLLLLELLGDV